MFRPEAKWIGEFLYGSPTEDIFPLLNLGSSTQKFRTETQPWIDKWVFKPARERDLQVTHMDLKRADGVDIVGDICLPEVKASLRKKKIRSILCSNLLEHVISPELICANMEDVLDGGGYLIVTCPYKYPYHPDPIDTMFRPAPVELSALFKQSDLIRGDILDCGTQFSAIKKKPKLMLRTFLRLCVPVYKPRAWWRLLQYQLWMFRTFRVSCVIFRKRSSRVAGELDFGVVG